MNASRGFGTVMKTACLRQFQRNCAEMSEGKNDLSFALELTEATWLLHFRTYQTTLISFRSNLYTQLESCVFLLVKKILKLGVKVNV